jgi:large subunit ribosomal protein L29
MKNTEIKNLNLEELYQKVASEQETLRKLTFAHQVASIENPMKIKETRKLIARLQTELTVKENAAVQ